MRTRIEKQIRNEFELTPECNSLIGRVLHARSCLPPACRTRKVFALFRIAATSRGPRRTGTARKQDVEKQRVPNLRR